MTDQDLVQKFIAERGVTQCPPVIAAGSEARRPLRQDVASERREWRREQKAQAEAAQQGW